MQQWHFLCHSVRREDKNELSFHGVDFRVLPWLLASQQLLSSCCLFPGSLGGLKGKRMRLRNLREEMIVHPNTPSTLVCWRIHTVRSCNQSVRKVKLIILETGLTSRKKGLVGFILISRGPRCEYYKIKILDLRNYPYLLGKPFFKF